MSNVYLDCGTSFCQGLKAHIQKYNIDRNWIIHSFEANPATYNHAKNIINKHLPELNITLHNKAVWVNNSKRKLTVEHNTRVGIAELLEKINIDPSCLDLEEDKSLWIGGASNIMEDNFRAPSFVGDIEHQAEEVGCIDFSEFILSNFSKADNIYIKFDIEGAEYSVLNKLIKTGTIDMIKEITIEWHNHLLNSPYDQQYIEQELHSRNIPISPWA
jgi:FkbM family methyltransferase